VKQVGDEARGFQRAFEYDRLNRRAVAGFDVGKISLGLGPGELNDCIHPFQKRRLGCRIRLSHCLWNLARDDDLGGIDPVFHGSRLHPLISALRLVVANLPCVDVHRRSGKLIMGFSCGFQAISAVFHGDFPTVQ